MNCLCGRCGYEIDPEEGACRVCGQELSAQEIINALREGEAAITEGEQHDSAGRHPYRSGITQ